VDSGVVRPLLVNLALLAATLAAVVAIGWPEPEATVFDAADTSPSAVPATPPQPSSLPSVARPAVVQPAVAKPSGVVQRRGKLDLNRATVEELQQLPGVGEVLAKRVVDRRAAHGPYRSVDELLEVKGIGKKRVERLQSLVSVGGAGGKRES
jgi:competence protein ComEA